MTIQLSDGDEQPTTSELERTAVGPLAPELLVAANAHATPTLVPPSDETPESEPPPTLRWTPPPVLVARSVRPPS